MKTLSLLTTAAGILLAISGPSLAASRGQAHRATDGHSAYTRDSSDNAFWRAPYAYAPNASGPRGSVYGVPERNSPNSFQGTPIFPHGAPVGTTRNDW